MKDQALYDAMQRCGVVLPVPLQTYYGNDKLHHGIATYRNGLLDTGQVRHSFIHPSDYNRDEDVLSFQFLNSENLVQLMTRLGEGFQSLLPDAFQPRAYEFLLQRLTDKFSILTKECDERVRQELPGGRSKKDFRRQLKVQELDTFIGSFVSKLLGAGPVTLAHFEAFIYNLKSSTNDACFEGKEDDVSKFIELAPDHRKYWLDHLIEMIGFFINPGVSNPSRAFNELCRQNITKYSKLLVLLKKYLIPSPTQPGLEWLEASSEQLRDTLDSLFQPYTAAVSAPHTATALAPHTAAVSAPHTAAAPSTSFLPKTGLVDKGIPKSGVVKPPPINPDRAKSVPVKTPPSKVKNGPGGSARGGGTIRTRNPRSPKKTNNHTRKNKYKRNNKNKKHKSSPKYRKVVPSSRSGSQSNRKKSKSKLPHKNVTFKRRRARK